MWRSRLGDDGGDRRPPASRLRLFSPAATSPEYHPPSGGPRRLHAQAADAGRFPRRAKRPVGGRGGIGAVFRPAGCEDALDLGELGLPFHRVAARSPRQLASRLSVFGSQLRRRRCRGACAPAATMPPMPLRKSSRAAPVRSGPMDWVRIDAGTGPADCLPAVRPHSRAGLIASGQSNRRGPSADPLCLDLLR